MYLSLPTPRSLLFYVLPVVICVYLSTVHKPASQQFLVGLSFPLRCSSAWLISSTPQPTAPVCSQQQQRQGVLLLLLLCLDVTPNDVIMFHSLERSSPHPASLARGTNRRCCSCSTTHIAASDEAKLLLLLLQQNSCCCCSKSQTAVAAQLTFVRSSNSSEPKGIFLSHPGWR